MISDKDTLVDELLSIKLPEPFIIRQAKETDLVVHFDNADNVNCEDITASKLENSYFGYILLDHNARKAYYHEELIDAGTGIDRNNTHRTILIGGYWYKTYSFEGFEAEKGINYPMVRELIEATLRRYGWAFELVITKNEATYRRFTVPGILIFIEKFSIRFVTILLPLLVLGILIYQLQNITYREKFLLLLIMSVLLYAIKILKDKVVARLKRHKK